MSTGDLVGRWLTTCARVGAAGDLDAARSAGLELVSAYASPDRAYHDLRHLAEVLDHVDELAAEADDPDAVRLAAWFHDAVYDATPAAPSGSSEEASAVLAAQVLARLGTPAPLVAGVARLVRLTTAHDPADGDRDGAVLCDADLAVLARDPDAYAHYTAAVRQEYAHVPDELFRPGRAAILRGLLDQPALFRTVAGRDRWERAARANVEREVAELLGR